jgi:putative addiction module component (TIGR02574 family)
LIDGKYVKDIIWFGLVQGDQGRALNIASTRTLSSGPRKLVVRISACGLPIINRWGKLGGKGANFMRGIKEIIQEAESLPVEERAMVIDSLLRSLNPPSMEIDREWVKVAKRRLVELRSGAVKPIPGNEVFAKIRERFEK